MSLDVSLTMPPCKHCGRGENDVYDANITHNLGAMAKAAGIYGVVWRPEENGIERTEQLIEPLKRGIAAMEADPAWFKQHNAPNGWGRYKSFLPWLKKYLAACEEFPQASVSVWR